MSKNKKAIIAIDFDGTLVEHKFPDMGQENPGAIAVCKELQAAGHRLILYTMRNDSNQGPYLAEAVKWCRDRGLEFWGVNHNPSQASWTDSIKVFANHYVDDAAIGCPLREAFMVSRPMVDWREIRKIFISLQLIQGSLNGD